MEALMTVLHEQVRVQVKKAQMDKTDAQRLESRQKYLQCVGGLEGLLLLQNDEWHQTASGCGYVEISLLHPLHLGKCFR